MARTIGVLAVMLMCVVAVSAARQTPGRYLADVPFNALVSSPVDSPLPDWAPVWESASAPVGAPVSSPVESPFPAWAPVSDSASPPAPATPVSVPPVSPSPVAVPPVSPSPVSAPPPIRGY